MGVVKLTSSKKAVQFITDEGHSYITSLSYLKSFLYGQHTTGFIVLKRLPVGVAPDRFPKSEVYGQEGVVADNNVVPLTTTNDGVSNKFVKERQQTAGFVDKKVF